MTKGRAATMTHDYKRNGTTTLFAALDVLTGTVIGQCLPRHRHEERGCPEFRGTWVAIRGESYAAAPTVLGASAVVTG